MKKLTALLITVALFLLALPTAALAADTIEYTVVTKTSNNYESGTNDPDYILIVGSQGITGWHELDNPQEEQSRNDEDTYNFDDIDVGQILYIGIRLDGSDNWQVEWIDVNGILFNLDGYWIGESNTVENSSSWDSPCKGRACDIFQPGDQVNYDIEVKTGEGSGAGTDAQIDLAIIGSNGVVKELQLDNPLENDAEAGTIDYYSFKGIDLGEIERIELTASASETDMWQVSYVKINGQLFDCDDYWLDPGDDETAAFYPATNSVVYDIRIDTEDEWWAGTDSDIYVKYVGDNGETDWFLMDKNGNNDFERGDSDSYSHTGPNIGTVRYIRLRNSGSDEWQIARVHFQGVTYHMHGHALEESEVEIPVDYSGVSEVGSAVSGGSLTTIIIGGAVLVAAVVVFLVINKKKQAAKKAQAAE